MFKTYFFKLLSSGEVYPITIPLGEVKSVMQELREETEQVVAA